MDISRNVHELMNIIQFLIGHNNKKQLSDWADHGSEHIGVDARAVLREAQIPWQRGKMKSPLSLS